MCGFVGFIDKIDDKNSVLTNMMNEIIHRGPDSEGQYIDDNVALGFRRLSIIDLEGGSQPLYNEDSTMVLVFNGEIYNYKLIREDLVSKGHIFKTSTDSEVLLHGYEEYGTELVKKLRGMFSFVIWDKRNQSLFCARDFFGIKPLYYSQSNGTFMFGSEIKSLIQHPSFIKELNERALENYLTFQYSPTNETFFRGIYKLPPAHYFIYKSGEMNIERYWEPEFETEDKSLEDYVDLIDDQFKESVEAHKISDVEVGCFLSSGVDSSYVASCFHGDKTFTVGFDYHKYNEIDYAKELSSYINIDNYHKIITTEEYWSVLPKVQYHMDEPLADPSAVALYFVSQLASEHVKVVLSGEGADELFGGYNIYREPMDIAFYTKLPHGLRKAIGFLAKFLPDVKGKNFLIRGSKTIEERFIGNAFMFTEKERKALLTITTDAVAPQVLTKPFYNKVKDKDDATKMQFLDIHMWMAGDILLKADKMSMAHSLELRVPFLDKEVMKLAGKIPTKYRVHPVNTKYAMRLAALRNIPEKVAQKKKLGFPVPVRVWLREEKYYLIVKEAFSSEHSKQFFDEKELLKILNLHYKGKKDNSRKIWTIYMFLVWYQQFFVQKG
ncbi:MAG: asparagine synthase (glutamine-hydrolyzing) [Firmicutes bacterium HGW-Firmicutes-1]|jgi:asparagine synthase (glutamine-hydrolysing)|nr:MAG: asparagine synthase (glutamine-hydrolyzing) [Firmicutes bacterium HGW-Firmicutes-1]